MTDEIEAKHIDEALETVLDGDLGRFETRVDAVREVVNELARARKTIEAQNAWIAACVGQALEKPVFDRIEP